MCLFVRVYAKIPQRPENLQRTDHAQTTPASCTPCPSFHDAGCPHESVKSLVPLSVHMSCNHLNEHQLCNSYSNHVKALEIHFKSVAGRCLKTAAPLARELAREAPAVVKKVFRPFAQEPNRPGSLRSRTDPPLSPVRSVPCVGARPDSNLCADGRRHETETYHELVLEKVERLGPLPRTTLHTATALT